MVRMLGVTETVRLLQEVTKEDLERLKGPRLDRIEFAPYRNELWQLLKTTFPSRPDLNCLQGDQVGEAEHPMVYYQKMKRKWQMETDSNPDANHLHTTMFRKILLDGLTDTVRSRLEDVVGITYKPKGEFCEHLTQ